MKLPEMYEYFFQNMLPFSPPAVMNNNEINKEKNEKYCGKKRKSNEKEKPKLNKPDEHNKYSKDVLRVK